MTGRDSLAWFAMVVFLWTAPAGAQQDTELINGDFSDWENNQPVGWEISVGATNGANQPESTVLQGAGPSLEMSGNARTLAWNLVRQSVKVTPGETLRLTFTAKVTGLKREGRQFNNCHVGVWPKDGNGDGLGNDIQSVFATEYQRHAVLSRIPPGAETADVVVFLSKTGTLNIRLVSLTRFAAKDSFQLLVEELTDKYSYFDHKEIDIAALQQKYRASAEAAASAEGFADIVADMFSEFGDVHTWLVVNGRKISRSVSSFDANYNFAAVDAKLSDVIRIGKFGLVGTTSTGIGYVRVATLSNVSGDELRRMQVEIKKRFDCPGMIVDLRRNRGGAEGIGQAIAGMFADKEYIYARQRFRSGKGFVETPARKIRRGRGPGYQKPIVCLCGPGAASSGEGFVMMMKALDHCTLIGQPTRGASGNPQPVRLPNGVDAWFSRWQSMNPDGTLTEDVGVRPDVAVQHELSPNQDTTFEKALQILSGD